MIQPRKSGNSSANISIEIISLKRMSTLVKKKGFELFIITVKPEDLKFKVSVQFKDLVEEFKDVFIDELPKELPPKGKVDFQINLKQDQQPPIRPVIRLSKEELNELQKQLHMPLNKGLIRPH